MPGQEDAFVDYEDLVLRRLDVYEARLVTRVRAPRGEPSEVQVIEFPLEEALRAFMRDPARAALSAVRNRIVKRAEVLRVDVVAGP